MAEATRSDADWQAHLEAHGEEALAELFAAYRDRLRIALDLRMDPRLQGRVDPSDVIQHSFIEAQSRLGGYLDNPPMSPWLWIRFLTLQRLVTTYRENVEVKARDVRRERSLNAPLPGASSVCLAALLVDDATTPSQAAVRNERQEQVRNAIEDLDPIDREIIALRHFEQMSNAEVSQVLNLKPATASQRYLRALKRMKDLLANLSGGSSDSV